MKGLGAEIDVFGIYQLSSGDDTQQPTRGFFFPEICVDLQYAKATEKASTIIGAYSADFLSIWSVNIYGFRARRSTETLGKPSYTLPGLHASVVMGEELESAEGSLFMGALSARIFLC